MARDMEEGRTMVKRNPSVNPDYRDGSVGDSDLWDD